MSILIEKVRASTYRVRGKQRYYRYWRCVRDGKIVNTFLTKKAAAQWVKGQRA